MNTSLKLTELPEELKVLAVTKGRSVEEIMGMLEVTGINMIGENRLDEAQIKFPKLPNEVEKHFIGKLQSRKIPKIVELFDVIQSLENLEQAKQIAKNTEHIQVMLQVNISGIEGRGGCLPSEAKTLISQIKEIPEIGLIGVMAIATNEASKAKEEFAILKTIQGDLQECSMGMSNDYNIAIDEGSTMIRIGRLLFKESSD